MEKTKNEVRILQDTLNTLVMTSQQQNECISSLKEQDEKINKVSNGIININNTLNNSNSILNKFKSFFSRKTNIEPITISESKVIESNKTNNSTESNDILHQISSELDEIKQKALLTGSILDKHNYELDNIVNNTDIVNNNMNKINRDINKIMKNI